MRDKGKAIWPLRFLVDPNGYGPDHPPPPRSGRYNNVSSDRLKTCARARAGCMCMCLCVSNGWRARGIRRQGL